MDSKEKIKNKATLVLTRVAFFYYSKIMIREHKLNKILVKYELTKDELKSITLQQVKELIAQLDTIGECYTVAREHSEQAE